MRFKRNWKRASAELCEITKVCVRSFFCETLTRMRTARRRWTLFAGVAFAAMLLTAVLVSSVVCLSIRINGAEIGRARSISEVSKIVASAEEQISEILGHEYSLGDMLTLTSNIGVADSGAEELERAIIASVDGVEEMYTLSINGELACAAESDDFIYEALYGVLQDYTTDDTTTVRFLDNVTISRAFVSESLRRDASEITEMISPDNDKSPFGLRVENTETITHDEQIEYETVYIDDDTMYVGQSEVVTTGENGVNRITQELVYVSGALKSRDVVSELVITPRTDEVIAVGTLERPYYMSTGEYIWPASGIITSYYGYRSTSIGSSNHKGLDIAGYSGQPIYASDGGKVIFSGVKSAYGYMVQILHDDGLETVYAHCSKLLVETGDLVGQGQEIAKMGSTGISSGVHCHFEIRREGNPIDPSTFLS